MGDTTNSTPTQTHDSDNGSGSTTTVTSPLATSDSTDELRSGAERLEHDETANVNVDENQGLQDCVLTPRPRDALPQQTMQPQGSIDYFSSAAILSHSVVDDDHAALPPNVSGIDNPSVPSGSVTEESSHSEQDLSERSTVPHRSTRKRPRATPRRSKTEHSHPTASSINFPVYPNQALSALHAQVHPTSPPHGLDPTHSSIVEPHGYRALLRAAGDGRSVRTAGNTPANTPGLYNPSNTHQSPGYDGADDASPVPSPYLHPFHRHPIKETAVVQSSVDTISGRKLVNQYEILRELGRGVHGKVKLARDLNNDELVAIKIVQRYTKRRRLGKAAASQEDKVKKEIAILKKCSHPNVVSLKEVIDDPEINKIYIVLEYCELGAVDWRCAGNKEIVLLEHRRLDAEAKGKIDVRSISKRKQQSDRIMQVAANRRADQRPGMPGRASSSFWSLEFGDSEEDATDGPSSEPVSRTISRVSSVAPEDSKSDTGEPSQQTPEDVDVNNPVASLYASETEFGDHHPLVNAADRKTSYSQLAGSVNSAYDTDDSRGRQSSVAESSSSRLTELVNEEVPEEHRYVPLLTLEECRQVFRDGVLGLEYLHYQGIVHRDIKPANLIRTSELVKISDFGVSYLGAPVRKGTQSEEASEVEGDEFDEEAALAKNVGTPAFYAPELCTLDFNGDLKTVTRSIDIWALGVTLYCLLFGRTPLTGENEFALMAEIAKADVFIPRQRLKAVDRPAVSSPKPEDTTLETPENKRPPHGFVHEDIDDDLYDLLKRLLTKDVLQRITLKEIKHHPWLLEGIKDPAAWLQETDPQRHTQGQKIEISQQEVKDALIPFKVIERAKSIAKKVGGVFGLGGSKSSTRSRSKSNAATEKSGPTSPQSVGPSAHKDGNRRPSMRLDDSVSKASRDHHEHHPLSQSVTASPQPYVEEDPFDSSLSLELVSSKGKNRATPARPSMPDRQESGAASVRTIRQTDFGRTSRHTPSPPAPASVTAGNHLEPSGGSNLGAIFGGASRSIMRTISRERRNSAKSSSDAPSETDSSVPDHLHGEPSIAFSTATAAGSVHQPVAQDRSSSRGIFGSPNRSRNVSRSSRAEQPHVDTLVPRTSTPSAVGSPRHRMSPVDFGGGLSRGHYTMNDDEPTEKVYHDALTTLNRKRWLDDEDKASRVSANSSSSLSLQACPPSPDDEIAEKKLALRIDREEHVSDYSSEVKMQSPPADAQPVPVSSVSSEDQIHPTLSQSTSFPSASQSMVSADSSLFPDQHSSDGHKDEAADLSDATTRNTLNAPAPKPFLPLTSDDDDGYTGDRDLAIHSESDSDSGEEFLTMGGRRKSQAPPKQGSRSASVSNAQIARTRVHADDKKSDAKTSRSGSTSVGRK